LSVTGGEHSMFKAFLLSCLFAGAAYAVDATHAAETARTADSAPTALAAPGASNTPVSSERARALGLDGAPNFRDIGGYATADGRHVRWDEVFRSNELSKLTPADAARVAALKVAAVVDLRTEEERQHAPSVWAPVPADVYESPKPTLAPLMHTILAEAATPEGARAGLIKFYSQMPDDYRTEYAAMFHRIAEGELPMVVHCTAGKDRTGVAMALLLTAVGVPRQTVVDDYTLTERLVPPAGAAAKSAVPVGGQAVQGAVPAGGAAQPLSPLAQLPEESRVALWRSDPLYIKSALDSMVREYGSIDGYLERGLGLSKPEIDSVRRRLLD
jgi:protein-tyrosine phosphatase